jgi:hypothetical protein
VVLVVGTNAVTTSAVINFAEQLEDRSSAFYEGLGARYPECRDAFLAFARSGHKIKRAILQTYRETVSDALETGYSFQGLDLGPYQAETELAADAGIKEALDKALALEQTAETFYREVAHRSRSLLATITMAFTSAAKRRGRRRSRLQGMRDEVLRDS